MSQVKENYQYDLLKGESFIKGFSTYDEALGHLKNIDTSFDYTSNFVCKNPNGFKIINNWHY